MPLKVEDIERSGAPISFLAEGQVQVRIGPSSAKFLVKEKIPLDGKFYICAGTIIFANGIKLRANFEINTHTFDFLERESVRCFIDNAWYTLDEEELFEKLQITKEVAFPYKWLTDIPLDLANSGPYPMKWPE